MNLIVLSDSYACYMECNNAYMKMEGFSKLDISYDQDVYIRKYAKSKWENADVTDCHTKILYKFDRMKNNAVHDFLSSLTDCTEDISKTTKVVLVDFSNETDDGYEAQVQEFLVLCSDLRPENGFLDYSGQLIATGDKVKGIASSDDGFKTVKFVPGRRGILCD